MKKGDKVWFTDPDQDISSGWYNIDRVCGEVFSLSNEFGSVEAFEEELDTKVIPRYNENTESEGS
tara:strand:+ start:8287 stop:8481 length:195 start_codon:yes stop_codon:yes gene_type:complete